MFVVAFCFCVVCEGGARSRRHYIIYLLKMPLVSSLEDNHFRSRTECWAGAGLMTMVVLMCCILCRSKVNCGEILATKPWQALTRTEGVSFFQVYLLREGVITESHLGDQ